MSSKDIMTVQGKAVPSTGLCNSSNLSKIIKKVISTITLLPGSMSNSASTVQDKVKDPGGSDDEKQQR